MRVIMHETQVVSNEPHTKSPSASRSVVLCPQITSQTNGRWAEIYQLITHKAIQPFLLSTTTTFHTSKS